ncbi:MAG: hypothetical protein ACRYGF_04440 [Janthinobacterium lividum]
MGWLELLPLLKRLLPLLSRMAPMLETFIATRSGKLAETEAADRLHENLKTHLADTAQKHDLVSELLLAQAGQIKGLLENMARQRAVEDRTAARLLEIESSVAALARTLRSAIILLGLLMLASIALLVFLLMHRSGASV